MRFVGIDVGKAKCHAAIMNQEGVMIDEFAFTDNSEGIDGFASRLSIDDKAVMESTGNVWVKLYEGLEEKRIPVILANPLKTRLLPRRRSRTTRLTLESYRTC